MNGHLLPPYFPNSKLAAELFARLTLLGLPRQTRRVLHWYVALPGVRSGKPSGLRLFDDEVWFWEEVVSTFRDRVDWRDATVSLRIIDGIAGLIGELDAERKSLDATEIAADAKRVQELVEALGGSDIGFETKPNISISRYHRRLAVIMKTAFVDAQAAIQAVMDLAAVELAARPTDHTARRRSTAASPNSASSPSPTPPRSTSTRRSSRSARAKTSSYRSTCSPANREPTNGESNSRSYDVTTEGLFLRPDQEVAPGRILAIRRGQVAALRRIYGVETDKGRLTDEAAENAAALKAVGGDGLQLTDDDDWRTFLAAKFEAHLAKSKSAEQSLDALIDLLKTYLRAFTEHSPMNIDDFGDNLLRKQFPRALTGQLVHDCGVYALRIAYMLSLLRNHPALRLEFRFVQLPVHIGLVITSTSAPIGAYLIHNDAFTKYTQADLDSLRAKWRATDEKGDPRQPIARTKGAEDQFLGELAADAFVPLTDIPFIVSAVPNLSGKSPRGPRCLVAGLPADPQQQAVRQDHPGREEPAVPVPPSLSQAPRHRSQKHHNTFLVPFWNEVGHVAWGASKTALEKASAAADPGGDTGGPPRLTPPSPRRGTNTSRPTSPSEACR